jgi:hypothetical protein
MGHRTTRLFTDLTRRFCVKRKLRIENEESKYRSSNSWMAAPPCCDLHSDPAPLPKVIDMQ